jgi:hypothetical protein
MVSYPKDIPQDQDKYIRYPDITNDFSNPLYDAEYNKSIDNKEEFWTQQAKEVKWEKFPS